MTGRPVWHLEQAKGHLRHASLGLLGEGVDPWRRSCDSASEAEVLAFKDNSVRVAKIRRVVLELGALLGDDDE